MEINRNLSGKDWRRKWDIDANNATLNTSFHCDWYGILCDYETKHIIAIYLAENNVHGELPINVSKLQFLLSFRIGANPVHGRFDRIAAAMPKYLLRLELSDTVIGGKFPKYIAKSVPILVKLQLSGNKVSGHIPDSIGELAYLQVLSIGETKLTGSIPRSISRLKNLWFLDMEALRLKGNLSMLYRLNKLRFIHLSSNELTGKIPENIGEKYPNLRELLLPNNKLHGNLPQSIGMLKKLKILNVAKNKLSGLIPNDIFGLNLKAIILSSNKFTGFETGRFSRFRGLDMFMASNLPEFNSSLQTILTYLLGSKKSIMQIDVSHSNVYGNLPAFVFYFQRLASLKLASNRVSGPIPGPYSSVPYFTLLDLQNNDFTGSIPTTFQRLLMLTELNVKGNKNLKGPVESSFLTLDYEIRIKERVSDTCPMVKFAHNNGTIYSDSSYYNRTYCYCDEHYFGNGRHCIKCMNGGKCRGTTKRTIHSKSGKLLLQDQSQLPISSMILNYGHFPFPNESDVKSIQKCPSTGSYYRICTPEGNCECHVNTTDKNHDTQESTTVYRVKIVCNKTCLCLLGHQGRYCSQCVEGYYKEGIRCYQCSVGAREGFQLGMLFGATIGTILLSLGILFISTKRLKLSVFFAVIEVVIISVLVFRHLVTAVVLQIVIIIFILGFSNYLQRCTALLKSGMFYLQIMDSLTSTTDIWPKSVYRVQVYISSSLNLSFSSLSCSLPAVFTVLAKSILLFLLPIITIGLLWLAYYLCKLFTKLAKEKLKEFNCNCRKYSIVIIDVAYFPIVKSCFSVIVGCKDIEGVTFMKRFVWIDCNSSEHISLTVIAILEVILYLIAVPFLIYLPLLFRNRKRLLDENLPNCDWLSPLVAPYKPKYRGYVEVIMLMRRLLIAILMAAFPANSSLQIQCITMLLLIAIIFQAVTRPYKDPTTVTSNDEVYGDRLGLENGIDIFMLSCVLLSFVCVGLSAAYGTLVPLALFLIMVSINGIFAATFFCSILYRLIRPGSHQGDTVSTNLHQLLINANDDCYLKDSSDS